MSLGSIVVYSVTSRESFAETPSVIEYLYKTSLFVDPPGPMVLVANKCDLISERQVSSSGTLSFLSYLLLLAFFFYLSLEVVFNAADQRGLN
jgi:GTPase SAR1 family protein